MHKCKVLSLMSTTLQSCHRLLHFIYSRMTQLKSLILIAEWNNTIIVSSVILFPIQQSSLYLLVSVWCIVTFKWWSGVLVSELISPEAVWPNGGSYSAMLQLFVNRIVTLVTCHTPYYNYNCVMKYSMLKSIDELWRYTNYK